MKKTCFHGNKFAVRKSVDSQEEWLRLKLSPKTTGFAVKVLRKTPLCEETDDTAFDAKKQEPEEKEETS